MSTFSVVATLTLSTTGTLIRDPPAYTRIRCCSDSKRKRGFGPQQDDKDANKVSGGGSVSSGRKSTFQQSGTTSYREPRLSSKSNSIQSNVSLDLQFEDRLEAIKRSTFDQKKAEQIDEFGKIEYDAPVESARSKTELGTKIGLGLAVVVFGFIFALGDFIPTQRVMKELLV